MMPCGGVCGGVLALGCGNEHQGIGAPHLHADIHVVCVHQYRTLHEIADLIAKEFDGKALLEYYTDE